MIKLLNLQKQFHKTSLFEMAVLTQNPPNSKIISKEKLKNVKKILI